jgi:hypothetical protein
LKNKYDEALRWICRSRFSFQANEIWDIVLKIIFWRNNNEQFAVNMAFKT